MRYLLDKNWILSKLHSHLSKTQLIFALSIIVGLVSGFAAISLKTIVYYIHRLLTIAPGSYFQGYIYLIFPLAGILLTVTFIKVFMKNKFGKGSAHIIYTIARKSSNVEKQTMYSHMISSALTVGFGGSAGLEAPIVVTGSAIGSNFGQVFQLTYRDRTLMLACGAAAGIAAVFDAPIAGVMFALEVLIVDMSLSSFIPLIVSAATGALLSKIILRESILLYFTLKQPFNYENVPFYIGLGILTGFVSIYYIRTYLKIEKLFRPLDNHKYARAWIGGLLLGIMILLFPPLFGEGYQSIKILASLHPEELLQNSIFSRLTSNEWILLLVVFGIGLLKVVAASLTIGSGGNGGNFAPSLFVGAFVGFAYAKLINNLIGISIPLSNFAIVGMAGILCGVMHAPLTGIFLIAEITGGYELMIPLMIVAAITFVIVKRFEPYSLDKKELAGKGYLMTQNRDKNILSLLDISELIEKDYISVDSHASLIDLTTIIAHSKRNIFPVVDTDNRLIGLIALDQIREILFELDSYNDILALEVMEAPAALVQENESIESIMQKFESTSCWNLPVVKDGKYVGFVSKSGILAKYREHLRQNFSEE